MAPPRAPKTPVEAAAKALVTTNAPSMFSTNAMIVDRDKFRALREALVEAGVLKP